MTETVAKDHGYEVCSERIEGKLWQGKRERETPFSHLFDMGLDINNKAYQTAQYALTFEEKEIEILSYEIRKKPQWWNKYKNPEIVEQWRQEFPGPDYVKRYEDLFRTDNVRISNHSRIFNYAIAELEYYEKERNNTGETYQMGPIDYIFYGDNTVSHDLKTRFKQAAVSLEESTSNEGDCDDQIFDLIDPNLYYFQYGVTPIIPKTESVGVSDQYRGEAERMVAHNFHDYEHTIKSHSALQVSRKGQWLPSVFDVSKDGQVTIKSYINNLNPEWHNDLYQPIADIFSCAIPAINGALSKYASGQRFRLERKRILYAEKLFAAEMAKLSFNAFVAYSQSPSFRRPLIEWKGLPNDSKKFDICGRQLNVITKMTNIVLTPDKPEFNGGLWHLAGNFNEDIVCTVIYFHDTENIESSNLKFRVALANPMEHSHVSLKELFGWDYSSSMMHETGSVQAIEDRIIVFPNMVQHCMAPFQLTDKSRPGGCKMLVFYIVDPFNHKVVTTNQVPPQQAEWWRAAIQRTPSMLSKQLPTEILDLTLQNIEWPMQLKKAKQVRDEFRDEYNRNYIEASTTYFGPFSTNRTLDGGIGSC